jgi:hypothetical protein
VVEGVEAAEPVVGAAESVMAVEWAAVVAVETLAPGAATAPGTAVVSGWASVILELTMVVSALGVTEARQAGSPRARAENGSDRTGKCASVREGNAKPRRSNTWEGGSLEWGNAGSWSGRNGSNNAGTSDSLSGAGGATSAARAWRASAPFTRAHPGFHPFAQWDLCPRQAQAV